VKKNKNHIELYDSSFGVNEQLPRKFLISFKEIKNDDKIKVQVLFEGSPVGDVINDNSYENDYYRYHDIFHYTFATMLGWSPCTRAMMKRKRKSVPLIDEIEDGARATITEEAISLMVFNEAKRKIFFAKGKKIKKSILKIIKEMTEPFEVRSRTETDWEAAIMKGYELFRILIKNNGGEVYFDMEKRTANYLTSTK
jgi:hypothetical protein